MNNTKITVELYANEYNKNNLVKSILDKNFGFELIFDDKYERSRRIISLEQVKELKESIDQAILAHEKAMKINFKK